MTPNSEIDGLAIRWEFKLNAKYGSVPNLVMYNFEPFNDVVDGRARPYALVSGMCE
jgi:hypothetical protein